MHTLSTYFIIMAIFMVGIDRIRYQAANSGPSMFFWLQYVVKIRSMLSDCAGSSYYYPPERYFVVMYHLKSAWPQFPFNLLLLL